MVIFFHQQNMNEAKTTKQTPAYFNAFLKFHTVADRQMYGTYAKGKSKQ
jgi:hypothetical protein